MSASDTCYLHSRTAATLECEVCRRPICNRCVQNAETRLTCPACLDDARRSLRHRWLATAVVILTVAGGGLGLWLSAADDAEATATTAEPASATARYTKARLAAQKDPDDPDKWLRVAEILIEDGHLAAAGKPLRVALDLAPDDAELNMRMGYYEYERGLETEALAHLERALALGADDDALTTTIETIRENAAAEANDQSAVAEERQAAALAAARADRARAEEAARAAEAETAEHAAATAEADKRRFEADGCSMPVERRGAHFIVPVQVNGVEAELLYDTGATGLMLTHAIGRSAGLDLDPGNTLEAQTANGTAYFLRTEVDALTVAGGVLRGVATAVCRAGDPCMGSGIDGLLGLRVMEAMGMTLDAAGSRVRFDQCD